MYPANRPDPGTLFDGASFLNLLIVALIARTEYKPHPNKISSLWFYMTVIITHGISSSFLLTYIDLFRTSHDDVEINMTSSYFDLSPLYGSSPQEQNTVRTFKDGKLKPDTLYESRLEVFPPGVAVLLVCFNRFHNYVVEQLAIINEGGRFPLPSQATVEKLVRARSRGFTEDQIKTDIDMSYKAALTKFDNDLFQTGRLYIPSSVSYSKDYMWTLYQHNIERLYWHPHRSPRVEYGMDYGPVRRWYYKEFGRRYYPNSHW